MRERERDARKRGRKRRKRERKGREGKGRTNVSLLLNSSLPSLLLRGSLVLRSN